MVEKKDTRGVKTSLRSKGRVSIHPEPGDQLDGMMEVVEGYDCTHWKAVTPICPTYGVHPPDRVGSRSLSSREMELRDDVKPLDVCEIKRVCGVEVPNGMEDHAYLSDKKP